MPDATQHRPSEVFVSRLREIRDERGISQAELARQMTAEGRPLSKVALLRIENGKRGLSLDEALALAKLLNVAPAHLLSPPDGSHVWPTDGIGLNGGEMANFLLFGDPLLITPPGQRTALRIDFVHTVEALVRAIGDARNGRDTAGLERATHELERVIIEHGKRIGQVADDRAGVARLPPS